AGRLGAVLGDSAQLAQEKTEAGGRYERQGGELGMGAPTRGERQDDKLDRGKGGEVAIARGRGEVAGSHQALGQRVAQVASEERPQQVPRERRRRCVFQAEIVKALRIARPAVKAMVQQVLARKA